MLLPRSYKKVRRQLDILTSLRPASKQYNSGQRDFSVAIELRRASPQLLPTLLNGDISQPDSQVAKDTERTCGGGRLLAICGDGTWGSRAWNAPCSGLLFNPPPS